jgi:hypothetical protein
MPQINLTGLGAGKSHIHNVLSTVSKAWMLLPFRSP